MAEKILYRSKTIPKETPADAVVLHCSDHRFQRSFHEFLTKSLKVGPYALLSTPGGGHFLPMEAMMSKYFKICFQSLSFHVQRNRASRVILIGHHDCLFFKEQVQFYYFEPDLNQKQFANLRKAWTVMSDRFPGLAIELYFADADQKGSVHFLKVE